jgi:DNA transposition AAA+ family ATPase
MTEEKTFVADEAIRAAAEKYLTDNKLTQSQFTGRLAGNFSTTRVAKYLNLHKPENKPEPDAPKVEAAIRAYLRHISRGAELNAKLYENSLSSRMAGVMRQIRRTGDIGLIHGDGGEGKTSGAILFCRENPDTIFVTAKHPYACTDWAIMKMVFDEFCQSVSDHWDGKGCKWSWLEKQLRGTQRLLIFDDAELMYLSAFRWAFSLHDATGIPMVFIGNDEVIAKITAADTSGKMVSRIGIKHHAFLTDDEDECAKKLIEQFAPGAGELLEVVQAKILRSGHSRRARKQLTLTANLREGSKSKDWLTAWNSAEEKLINPETRRSK